MTSNFADPPVRVSREERRAALLAAARDAFVIHGYHAASMEEIADRSGASKPVLYQHFESKLELYLALLDQGCATLLERIKAALSSTTDNRQRLRATISVYFDLIEEPASGIKLVYSGDLINEPAVRFRVTKAEHDCAELVGSVIAQNTPIPSEQALILGAALTGLAQNAAQRWIEQGGSNKELATRLLATLAWRGISSFPLANPNLD
ncbi:MAG: TetR/AcrR family transcriptional regulator [Actinobacteria bacterium]|nr:TetR/AcrR family transcriptional regulator [Actinomycetota bacterium]